MDKFDYLLEFLSKMSFLILVICLTIWTFVHINDLQKRVEKQCQTQPKGD